MKTFHKNSKCNPHRHAPNIQSKWLLLTCPIGTHFLSARMYQQLLWEFRYPLVKTSRPLTSAFFKTASSITDSVVTLAVFPQQQN